MLKRVGSEFLNVYVWEAGGGRAVVSFFFTNNKYIWNFFRFLKKLFLQRYHEHDAYFSKRTGSSELQVQIRRLGDPVPEEFDEMFEAITVLPEKNRTFMLTGFVPLHPS